MPQANPRALAAKILVEVIYQKHSLKQVFTSFLPPDTHHSGLIKELCYGSLRWLKQLEFIVQQLLKKPIKEHDLYCLLIIGCYQLLHTHVAQHAAVTETVDACRALAKGYASGLINAVLRNFLRQKEPLLAKLAQHAEAYYAHPNWLLQLLQCAYPQTWQAIADANNQHPPFALRVNSQQHSREAYLKLLAEQAINAKAIAETSHGIILDKPIEVWKLPGFMAGAVSVQDGAAQLSADLLELAPQLKLLDACAAPGGKTMHILERESSIDLLALDKDEKRLEPLRANLQRLQLKAQVICADASQPHTWWDGHAFDRILLDAPCSGTGVIRRHPDIKVQRRSSDIELLAIQQLTLLKALWPLLKPGGILVYATCSVLPRENEQVILDFLTEHPDAQLYPIKATWGQAARAGRQLLPTTEGMDGFYYARLIKSPRSLHAKLYQFNHSQ